MLSEILNINNNILIMNLFGKLENEIKSCYQFNMLLLYDSLIDLQKIVKNKSNLNKTLAWSIFKGILF